MTSTAIIVFCLLLLLAYCFDLTSARTKIPSVLLLLALGWGVRQTTDALGLALPDFNSLLSIFGTIGLILIVLEGSLELELNRSKKTVILKSLGSAVGAVLALSLGLAAIFSTVGSYPFRDALVNIVPLCVISSSIAIPSVRYLAARDREFVVYESSASDIAGVMLFNFVVANAVITVGGIGVFLLQLLIIAGVSAVSVILLSLLLGRLQHSIKAVPIILLVLLIYAVSKVYNLPGLLFILVFGLFLGNLDELKGFRWIEKLRPERLNVEVHRFRDLLVEVTFVVRALFFLLFGYVMHTAEILDLDSLPWAVAVCAAIFGIRVLLLRLMRIPLAPLATIAPRGLITILLFLSVPVAHRIPLVSRSLIVQVIILSALVMMAGMLAAGRRKVEADSPTLAASPGH